MRGEIKIDVSWHDRGREPECPPDPQYPKGQDIDLSMGRKSCQTALPYPAKRCGYFTVYCRKCQYRAIITTAGRPDDPKSVRLPCKGEP